MPQKNIKRSNLQNRALHLYFRLVANALNDAGYTVSKTLSQSVDIDWNSMLFKELIWKQVQKKQLGKISTSELTTKEIDEVFDTINRYLGEKFFIHEPFPSIEDITRQQQYDDKQ